MLLVAALAISSLTTSAQTRSLAPYVPTPADVVERMLMLAKTGPNDLVYDLGCGDGRIVIAAALKFGARGVGVDIDEKLIRRADQLAMEAGVASRVTFRMQDALTIDVSAATVVTLYLGSASNLQLRPRLLEQLRPGARIVSHNYPMGDWEPDRIDTVTDTSGKVHTLYLWTVDGQRG